jgi:hypothetical protein
MVSACEVGWYSTICVECCRIGRHCVAASETSWKSALLEPEREREAMLSTGRRKTSSLCRNPQLARGTTRWTLLNNFENAYRVERIHVLSDRIGVEARVKGPLHMIELQWSWPRAQTLRHRLFKATVTVIHELDTLRCEGDHKLISPVEMLNLFCRCIADGLGG